VREEGSDKHSEQFFIKCLEKENIETIIGPAAEETALEAGQLSVVLAAGNGRHFPVSQYYSCIQIRREIESTPPWQTNQKNNKKKQ
jgi:hypothetical protein